MKRAIRSVILIPPVWHKDSPASCLFAAENEASSVLYQVVWDLSLDRLQAFQNLYS